MQATLFAAALFLGLQDGISPSLRKRGREGLPAPSFTFLIMSINFALVAFVTLCLWSAGRFSLDEYCNMTRDNWVLTFAGSLISGAAWYTYIWTLQTGTLNAVFLISIPCSVLFLIGFNKLLAHEDLSAMQLLGAIVIIGGLILCVPASGK